MAIAWSFRKLIKIILILLTTLIPISVFGANVYVDDSYGPGGDGSCAAPYDSIKDIRWSATDDYYFKEVHAEQINSSVTVKVDGTAQNRILIGAYTKSGQACLPTPSGEARTKPVIGMSPADKYEILVIKGSHITVQDIEFQDGNSGVRVSGDSTYGKIDGITIQYCTFTRGEHGIRVLKTTKGADMDNGNILYNVVNLEGSQEQEDDCIDLYSYDGTAGNISGWRIKGNRVDSCPHFGIYVSGNNNVVEENYISDINNANDGCIELASQGQSGAKSDGTIARYNYCEGAEYIQVSGTENARIHHNVIDCNGIGRCTDSYAGDTAIKLDTFTGDKGNNGTWVYNNTIINLPNENTGLRVRTKIGDVDGCSDCRFFNNIVTGDGSNTKYKCFYILDEGDQIDASDVHWYNNVCYNWGNGSADIANIEGVRYKTASAFNSSNKTDAGGNFTSDPQLMDIRNQQYWPASTESKVWQSGFNTGPQYKGYLLETSNFSSDISKAHTREENKPNIGAYTVGGSIPESSKNLSSPTNLKIRK